MDTDFNGDAIAAIEAEGAIDDDACDDGEMCSNVKDVPSDSPSRLVGNCGRKRHYSDRNRANPNLFRCENLLPLNPLSSSMSESSMVGTCHKYYTVLRLEMKSDGENCVDMVLQYHRNGLVIVSLAPNHFLLQNLDTNIKVTFSDRPRQLSKKARYQGNIGVNSILCTVTTDDDRAYIIHANVCGTLMETNDQLIANPSLLLSAPLTCGYLAIIKLTTKADKFIKNKIEQIGLIQNQYVDST